MVRPDSAVPPAAHSVIPHSSDRNQPRVLAHFPLVHASKSVARLFPLLRSTYLSSLTPVGSTPSLSHSSPYERDPGSESQEEEPLVEERPMLRRIEQFQILVQPQLIGNEYVELESMGWSLAGWIWTWMWLRRRFPA